MKLASKTWIPLAAALFLAPIIGGQIYVDAMKLEPGASVLSLVMKGAPETPWLSHAYLGIFVVAAAVWLAFSQKVIAIPKIPMAAMMILFGGCLVASISGSSFKLVSIATAAEWLLYLVVFFVAAAVSGRGKGSWLLLGSIVAGCALVSAFGIREYGETRALDPTWRIFAGWVHPNVLAGMLIVGFLLALGFTVVGTRLIALLAGIGASLILVAIFLTQSRGVIYVSLPAGLAVLVLGSVCLSGSLRERGLRVARLTIPILISLLLIMVISISGRKLETGANSPSALTRVTTSSDNAREQSSGFRRLLWKSSIVLILEHETSAWGIPWPKRPSGYGLGSFRYEGSRPGLVAPTQLAHNSFLQLGVEGGLITSVFFILSGFVWLFYMFRGIRNTPSALSLIRIAIVSAIVASVAHNLVDSDLYHFGIGVVFFALLGIGLSVAADGVSPEYLPTPIRISFPFGAIALVATLLFAGLSKLHLSQGLTAVMEEDASTALEKFDKSINNGIDGESFYLKGTVHLNGARIVQNDAERLDLLKKAASLNPSPKFYRALAREQATNGNRIGAVDAFTLALKRDPNNLQTLSQLLELYVAANEIGRAKETALRMVEVEKSPSYTIRAISEVVPVQTFEARMYLASLEPNKHKVALLLKPAVLGFQEYVRNTLPRVIQNAKAETGSPFAGETTQSAQRAVDAGRQATLKLMDAYRSLADRQGLSEASEALAQFDEAADSLRSISK